MLETPWNASRATLSLCPLNTGSFFAFIGAQLAREAGGGEREGLVGSWTPRFRGPSS